MASNQSTTHVIETHPEILGGKPVVRGTRIPVSIIFDMAGNGYSIAQIKEQYPTLSNEVILQVLELGEYLQRSLKEVDLKKYLEQESMQT
ncbi:DUF433 domain-containing protein [Candidatus Bathyarchaeota archaeon]|nr:DUF433 domain-containing protein [Candidatus Bathyarchaeota archaeon]